MEFASTANLCHVWTIMKLKIVQKSDIEDKKPTMQ